LIRLSDDAIAVESFSRAARFYEDFKQPTDEARCWELAGECWHRLGHEEAALHLFEEASKVYRETFGESDPRYANSLEHRAQVSMAVGDYGLAKILFNEALEIRRKILGEDHPDTAASYSDLASLATFEQDYELATTCAVKALDIRRKSDEPSQVDIADSM